MARSSPRGVGRTAETFDQILKQASRSESAEFEQSIRECLQAVCASTGWPIGHVAVPHDRALHSTGIWVGDDGDDEFAAWREARSATSFVKGEGLAGAVWRAGEPVAIALQDDEPERAVAESRSAPGSAFGFPVIHCETLYAVVEVFHPRSNVDSEPLVTLARCLGPLLGQLADRAQRASDQTRLLDLVEESDDAVIAIDGDGIIVNWNTGAERLYGYRSEEAVGASLGIIVPEEMSWNAPVTVRVLRNGRRLEQFETVRRRKDGDLVHVSLTASPVVDDEGRTVGASSIERDITRRKQFEAERAKAQAEAESAHRAKNEFLANVSHELRTPMSAILGLLELSLDEELSGPVQDYLSTAYDSAQVLLYLLNDLLDFSRAEAGTFELEYAPFSLRANIDQAVARLAERAREKGLDIRCRVHPDAPDALVGDAGRVQKIVMNLLGNAIKFTDSGQVVVEVAPGDQEEDFVELLLTITDTGIGISPEDQDRIFAPFTQVDASSTRKYSGAGLGLTIARELAARMNGRVWVESELGRGSQFHCTLRIQLATTDPLSLDERSQSSGERALPRPQDNVAKNPSPATTKTTRPLRILVAEDTAANQKIVSAILHKRGHLVEIATNGMEAVDKIQRTAFDVVLMDAQMPIMNGLQAAAAIRHIEDSQRSAVPIVAMTAHAMREDREKCLAAGMNAYLAKPIDAAELIKVVERHARGPHAIDGGSTDSPRGASMASPSANRPSLDVDAALERLGGSREIFRQVIQMFRDDAPGQATAIRQALEGGNLSAVALAAHNLRGSALILGASQLVDAAQAVEEAADGGDATETRSAMARLDAELARLMAELAAV